MKYHHKAFVRWDDLDAMGHVNNAKYLTFAQEARFEWSFVLLSVSSDSLMMIHTINLFIFHR